jgi:LTXXQ motif family protein
MKSGSRVLLVGVVILSAAALASIALARGGGGRGGGRGGAAIGTLCFSGGQFDRSLTTIDLLIKPSGNQKTALDDLRKGAKEYAETMSRACSGDSPMDIPAKLAASDKRLEAALTGLRKLKPVAEKFYDTLNDEQKMQVNLFIELPGL